MIAKQIYNPYILVSRISGLRGMDAATDRTYLTYKPGIQQRTVRSSIWIFGLVLFRAIHMSIDMIKLVFDCQQPLTAAKRLCLLSLAENANQDGECWPSLSYTARRCGVKVRAIQYTIRQLQKEGYLSIEGRGGRSNMFKLNADKLSQPLQPIAPLQPAAPLQPIAPTPATHCTPPLQPIAPRTLKEPKRTPIAATRARVAPSVDAAANGKFDPFELLASAFPYRKTFTEPERVEVLETITDKDHFQRVAGIWKDHDWGIRGTGLLKFLDRYRNEPVKKQEGFDKEQTAFLNRVFNNQFQTESR